MTQPSPELAAWLESLREELARPATPEELRQAEERLKDIPHSTEKAAYVVFRPGIDLSHPVANERAARELEIISGEQDRYVSWEDAEDQLEARIYDIERRIDGG